MVAYLNNNGLSSAGGSSTGGVPMPASIVAGDLLITNAYVNSDVSASMAVSAGWTLIGIAHNAGYTIGKAYRVATGSDAAPNWSWTGSFAFSANVFHYNGTIYATAPIGAHSEVVGSGTSAQGTAITLTAANSFVALDTNTKATNQTIPLPAGWTTDSNFSSVNGSERLSHQIFTSSGSSSGNPAVAISTDSWGYALTEIRTQAPPAIESGTIAQTLNLVTQSATGAEWAKGSAAQTLKLVTQSATGQQWVKGPIVQMLKLVTQSSTGWAEVIGSAAQTLFKITQLASPATQIFTGTAAQRLKLVTQAASGWHTIFGAAAQRLFRVTQSAEGAVAQFVGQIAQTLKLIQQNVVGQQWTQGPIVQVLPLVRQTVRGWAEIIGDAAMMLPLIQQVVHANEVTLDTLFFATTQQLNDYVGRIQKQIRSTWHGPPDDPLPPVV